MSKVPYSVRVMPEVKERALKIGKEYIEELLKLTVDNYNDNNVPIAILTSDVKKLQDKYNKNEEDIFYHEKRINELKEENNVLKKMLILKNEELRKYIDLEEHENNELKQMFEEILKLINNDTLNELEVQEIIENRKYCSSNKIINYIIVELKKTSVNDKYIDILNKVKI